MSGEGDLKKITIKAYERADIRVFVGKTIKPEFKN